jgi:hypothetical protein
VFVICRSEGNIDMRRFYNPPVDGRGATYAKWQASYKRYLASEYGFKVSNLGYGKYPTQEAAQKSTTSGSRMLARSRRSMDWRCR